ncbi:MAG: sulfatase-like hydrolase/transferase [Planctomycetaceae bacterium]|nr:sulfatase-like hydrolase/transferase [Planctomycetaceae bacterium]
MRYLLPALLMLIPTAVAAADRPSLLFFLVDDMGVGDTSVPFLYSGDSPQKIPLNELYRTPNMEKLAATGRRFTNACSYSVCSPTRVSIMTGQAAPRHRVTTWTHPKQSSVDTGLVKTKTVKSPNGWRVAGVDRSLPLLPRLMKQAGYRTLFAGKAHFGPDDTPSGNPMNLGFDCNIAGFGGGGPGSYWGTYNYSANHRTGAHVWDVPGLEKYHGTDTFLTEAITLEMNQAIEEAVNAQEPFFAYMSHYAVHAPWQYPDARFQNHYPQLKGDGLAFATLVEGMDKSLGDMLDKLRELGVAEETLVIFFSDNGSAWSADGPYRDKKGSRFEGGVRVPLIVSWAQPNPQHPLQAKFPIPANSVEHDIVTCVDMMPTLLKLAGANIPTNAVIDGHDISPYFTGTPGTHRPQEFLTHFPHRHRNTLFSTYRQEDWKIVYSYASAQWELYNLVDDPFERRNVVKDHPDRARSLAWQMVQQLDAQSATYPQRISDGQPVKPEIDRL